MNEKLNENLNEGLTKKLNEEISLKENKKYYEEAMTELSSLVNKQNIFFVEKGRLGAELILSFLKNKGFINLILQDEGGWHTYEKSGEKLGFNVIKAKTLNGLLVQEEFPFLNNSVFLINTNPGYAYSEDLFFLKKLEEKGFLINDVSGSIGEPISKIGQLIIGSFGNYKPLSVSSGGGFIAFNSVQEIFSSQELLSFVKSLDFSNTLDFSNLLLKLKGFKEKKNELIIFSNNLKQELSSSGFKVLNMNSSINVFVGFDSVEEKETLIKLCLKHNLESVLCPCYIRTNRDAISIEVKRLF